MYRVGVYDNFHYMEDSATTLLPDEFATYEEALAVARAIVEESCEAHNYDLKLHRTFGDDAVILGPGGQEFSAWKYAEELCRQHGWQG